MANLPESSTFDAGVYQIETTDAVLGGASGVTNTPLKNLANRTKYLKDHVDAIEAAYAPKASPTFTGTPAAPTASVGTNTTQLATTAFTVAQIGASAAPIGHVGSGGTAHSVATSSAAGFMSATDKSKLDAIAEGATANLGTVTAVNATAPISSTGGTTPTISIAPATNSAAGSMSAADKAKLDGIAAGAQPNTVTSVFGRTGAVVLTAADVPTLNQNTTGSSGSCTGNSATATYATTAGNGGVTSVNGATGAINLSSLPAYAASGGYNGYQKLPSGLIIQWGNITNGAITGSATISWPIAFPNACLCAVGSDKSSNVTGADIVGIGTLTSTSGVFWLCNNADGANLADFFWMAIGY